MSERSGCGLHIMMIWPTPKTIRLEIRRLLVLQIPPRVEGGSYGLRNLRRFPHGREEDLG